ncbi:uncharacterized protein LOC116128724 [Pistacia vera]|uniref:uncharacterized protein LOC116128724 n=1 Tax=Pistacia vera TaxID=55513 RepID=UPI00126350BD|nr:uncharacterized protein LOC116128724 [Pistacia vera]
MFSFQHPPVGEFEDDFDYYFNLFSFSNNDLSVSYLSEAPEELYGDELTLIIIRLLSPEFYSGCVSNVINPPAPPPLPEFLPEIPTPPLAVFSFEKSSSTDHESSHKETNWGELVDASDRPWGSTERRGKNYGEDSRARKADSGRPQNEHGSNVPSCFKICQEREELLPSQELQTILESPIIQEKLYSEEKCLVPGEILQTLKNDPEIQSKSSIF